MFEGKSGMLGYVRSVSGASTGVLQHQKRAYARIRYAKESHLPVAGIGVNDRPNEAFSVETIRV
jgi:hypothetical protein